MRCPQCGWVPEKNRCPCGSTSAKQLGEMVPVGARVAARPGRGRSMTIWVVGEVTEHLGRLHLVRAREGDYWCELDDLLPESPRRDRELEEDGRVWALWLDGRWYPGRIDGREGRVCHVIWDDGDAMWLDSVNVVPLSLEYAPPRVGNVVAAPRWDGEYQAARVEQCDEGNCRVVFGDGEESWVSADDLSTFPPNPFLD